MTRNMPDRLGDGNSAAFSTLVQPGQFAHLRSPSPGQVLLRRPFSIFQAQGDTFSVLYKTVGKGTEDLSRMSAAEELSAIGPLGRREPTQKGRFPRAASITAGAAKKRFLISSGIRSRSQIGRCRRARNSRGRSTAMPNGQKHRKPLVSTGRASAPLDQ